MIEGDDFFKPIFLQEFEDDVQYFLDALKRSNQVSTRCLAALNLAQKCMSPAFRMHLRAHGTVIKVHVGRTFN